jgi:hypothetical protein
MPTISSGMPAAHRGHSGEQVPAHEYQGNPFAAGNSGNGLFLPEETQEFLRALHRQRHQVRIILPLIAGDRQQCTLRRNRKPAVVQWPPPPLFFVSVASKGFERTGFNAKNMKNAEKKRRNLQPFPVKTPGHKKPERDNATEIGKPERRVGQGSGSESGNGECRSRNSERGL